VCVCVAQLDSLPRAGRRARRHAGGHRGSAVERESDRERGPGPRVEDFDRAQGIDPARSVALSVRRWPRPPARRSATECGSPSPSARSSWSSALRWSSWPRQRGTGT